MKIAAAVIVGMTVGYLLQPQPTTDTVTVIETETIVETVQAPVNVVDFLRRIDIDPPATDKANAQCAYALQRKIDEPLDAMIVYIERRYDGDACAAYLHEALYGYY